MAAKYHVIVMTKSWQDSWQVGSWQVGSWQVGSWQVGKLAVGSWQVGKLVGNANQYWRSQTISISIYSVHSSHEKNKFFKCTKPRNIASYTVQRNYIQNREIKPSIQLFSLQTLWILYITERK